VHLLTYLLTQLARAYKAGNIYEKVEDRAKATINGLYKVVHWLSIAAKMTLNNLWARFEVIDSLHAAKMAIEIGLQLSNDSDAM